MKRSFVIPLLLAALLPAARAHARPAPGARVVTTAHGVQLILTLPRTGYPQDALVRATVRVRNVFHRVVGLLSDCSDDCVDVLGADGSVLYPPAVSSVVEPKGIHPVQPIPLPAGRTLTWHPYIVVRGNTVRASIRLGKLGVSYHPGQQAHTVTTPPLPLSLSLEPSPAVELTLGPEIGVQVEPAPSKRGVLHYAYSYRCFESDGSLMGGADEWDETGGTHFDVMPWLCPHFELRLVAGWLNHPVARIDYPPAAPAPALGLTLGAPLAPAHLTASQATALATAYAPEIATHPTTIAYGSLDLRHLFVNGQSVGTVDVWEITITGLVTPSPGPIGHPPIFFQNLAVIVGDTAGEVLFAQAY